MPFMANEVTRHFPLGNVLVIRVTVVGRHIDMATPRSVRNTMICMPVVEAPRAMVKMMNKKLPVVHMSLGPSMSATLPNTCRRQPAARA